VITAIKIDGPQLFRGIIAKLINKFEKNKITYVKSRHSTDSLKAPQQEPNHVRVATHSPSSFQIAA